MVAFTLMYGIWVLISLLVLTLRYKKTIKNIPKNHKGKSRSWGKINRRRNELRARFNKEYKESIMMCFLPVINIILPFRLSRFFKIIIIS